MDGNIKCGGSGSRRLGIVLLIFAGFGSSTVVAEERHFIFDILRNGKPIGEHELMVERMGNETHVVARSAIDVTLLGFSVYRMRYEAREQWDEHGIRELSVEVDDEGREIRITGQRRDGWFHWSDLDGREYSVPMPVFPTNHWNPEVLEADRVLNTLTGRINQVTVAPVADDSAKPSTLLPEAEVAVYRYQGDLNIHTWYDYNGLWHGLRFKGRDGSDIEYVCRNCADPAIL